MAAELKVLDNAAFELDPMRTLIDELFQTSSIDEVEPLVLRYREAVIAYAETDGGWSPMVFQSLIYSARLHEVLCICTPRLEPLTTAQ